MVIKESEVAILMDEMLDAVDLTDLAFLLRRQPLSREEHGEQLVRTGEEVVAIAKQQHQKNWAAALAVSFSVKEMQLLLRFIGAKQQQQEQQQQLLNPFRILIYKIANEYNESDASRIANHFQLTSMQHTDALIVLQEAVSAGHIGPDNLTKLTELDEKAAQLCQQYKQQYKNQQQSASAAIGTDSGDGSEFMSRANSIARPINESQKYIINSRLCVIVNINKMAVSNNAYQDRIGSLVDRENLHDNLRQYYEIEHIDDPKKVDFTEKLLQLKNKVRNYDMLLFIVMAHGDQESILLADAEKIKYKSVIIEFFQDGCLTDKPKVFIFQCCRGNSVNQVEFDSIESDGNDFETKPYDLDDLCIMHSTYEGYKSCRDREKGSLFVQAFCTALKESVESEEKKVDILDLQTRINSIVSKMRFVQNDTEKPKFGQTAISSHTLRKKLYLIP